MFKIGQKVVCKNGTGTVPRIYSNKIYTVSGITRCTGCGAECLELEETLQNSFKFKVKCGKCNEIYISNDANYLSSRFEPLKYDLLDNKDIISELIEERADIKVPELVEN
jgi:hypothetical protein